MRGVRDLKGKSDNCARLVDECVDRGSLHEEQYTANESGGGCTLWYCGKKYEKNNAIKSFYRIFFQNTLLGRVPA